jgi:hypothetical protein
MTQAAKVVVPAEWKMVPVDALTRWRDAFAEELEAWDISPPLHHVKASHDEINALLAAASHPQDGSAAMLQVPDGLSRIDAEFWLRHRSDVIEACRKAGITIVTAERGVHLMSLGNIKAQAAPQSPAQADHLVDANKMTRADPVAKPLTREQIESMRRDGMEPDDYPEPWAYTRGVRDAERAHGIGRPAAGEWGAL